MQAADNASFQWRRAAPSTETLRLAVEFSLSTTYHSFVGKDHAELRARVAKAKEAPFRAGQVHRMGSSLRAEG
jgi:hypothetical protein